MDRALVMDEIGKAGEILFYLDIKLNNSLTGNKEQDKNTQDLRFKIIHKALDLLKGYNWLKYLK